MSSRRSPIWHEVTAIFGGRFDPPHRGHREAVRGLFNEPGVKQVWILPSPTPPHKSAVASIEDRIEMARLCFTTESADPSQVMPGPVRLDLREVERGRRELGKPTYSFDTLQELRQDVRNLAFVIGTDQLAALPSWHRFPEILGLCHWIILRRQGQNGPQPEEILRQWAGSGLIDPVQGSDRLWGVKRGETYLGVFPTPAPALSSTEIREAITRKGQAPQNSLWPPVAAHLLQRTLYGSKPKPLDRPK